MNNSTGSKDNTNVTTSNISSKVVQTEVTSHANTSKMVQKEMITVSVWQFRIFYSFYVWLLIFYNLINSIFLGKCEN